MKKHFIVSALALLTCSSFYSLAQNYVQPVAGYIEYNKLKYGADRVAVGTISATVSEKIKAKPDTVEFSIRYLTEDATPSEASSKNATNMKALTTYLAQLGIKPADLTTISYRNYEQTTQKTVEKQGSLYETTITVNLPITADKFASVIGLLEKNSISNVEKRQPTDTFYTFSIAEKATDAQAAKELAQKKYQTLTEQLKAQGITDITIEKYHNQQSKPEQQEVTRYFVENTLKIRIHDFDLLGKIIAKAQILKMNVNNDMNYSVSDETRNKLLTEAESQLLTKLTNKAQLLLANKDYQLGAVQNLQIHEQQPIIQPRNYNFNSPLVNSMAMDQVSTGASIDIQAPTDFDINISLSGSFDILIPTHKP